MNRWVFVAAPAVAASLALLAYRSLLVTTPPRAVITPDHRRVSAKDGLTPVLATYRIENRGGRDLVLGEFATSCGCSSASVEPKVLRPGQAGEIRVEGHPPESGEKDVTVHLASNAHPDGELTVRMTMVGTAKEVPFVRVDSGPVQFGRVRAGESEMFFIETTERPGVPPWIKSVSTTVEGLTLRGVGVEDMEIIGQGIARRYRYRATFAKVPPVGEFRGEVAFAGEGDGPGVIHRMPVLGRVRPAVFATPASLYLSRVKGEPAPRMTVLLTADDPAFRLVSEAKVEGPDAVAVESKGVAGGPLVYEVEARSPSAEASRATIVFRTNHPDLAEVRVPITIAASIP